MILHSEKILCHSLLFLTSEILFLCTFLSPPFTTSTLQQEAARKLGFSVATIVEPDVLILDEVLSVGDVKFQKKSGDKLKSMMGSGVTVLLVSHSIDNIRELCTRAIWLDHGKLIMDGEVDYVCDAYIEAAKKASEEELSGIHLE